MPSEEIPLNLDALPGEDLWGVYRFKQGFGGQVVRHVGVWDKPISNVGYRIYQVGIDLRNRTRTVPKRLSKSVFDPSRFSGERPAPPLPAETGANATRPDMWRSVSVHA